jgi:hypothetical protein
VSKVETQLSFPNMLVQWLTAGIYTPMSIKVTCAQSGAHSSAGAPSINLTGNITPTDLRDAYMKAADEAVETGKAVLVRY